MGRHPTVLLADDEPALLDLYTTWLDDEGVEIVRASCGAEALDRCDERDVDVAILDRHMPRVSGDDVYDRLRERDAATRVAFVTAATPDVDIVDLDIHAYLTKPVEREEFVALVRSLVRRDRLPAQVERYVSALSKRAALLESTSTSVLQADPTYLSFEEELSRLAQYVDRRLDDPYLQRTLPDGGRVDPSADRTT